MDRTLIGPWKAEERDLSEILHKKLHGLTLLYPPTEDLRKCLCEDMFLKPNPQAFFHVMHYLFKLHDPVEFRKRFYWPITDKKAEANFRSSTIDYLKYLDGRHHLHWKNLKSYLVQMPGGMKFINFLLDFVSFVVNEQIKHREKHLTSDIEAGQVSDLNMKRMRKQNEYFKEYASAYISDADSHIAKLKAKTLLIQNDLQTISKAISLDVTLLIDDAFVKEFKANNRELFRQKFMVPVVNIVSLEPLFAALKETIDNFQNKKAEFKIDKDALRRAIIKIQQLYPERLHVADEDFQATPYDDTIKIDSLISAFNVIHESIEEHLTAANKKPRSSNFVMEELSALKTELQQIETQITDFQKKLNSEMKKRTYTAETQEKTPMRIAIGSDNANSTLHNKENNLLLKFVATPPIKLEILEGSRKTNTRLPLLDDFTLNVERSLVAGARAGMDSLNNLLALPRSTRKPKNADVCIDLNSTLNKSKIIDPMQLLRTINKDTVKASKMPAQNDRSALDFKWKERQCMFGKDIENSPGLVLSEDNIDQASGIISVTDYTKQKVASTTTISSPFTPFNCNERTRITRTPLLDTSGGGGSGSGSLLYPKKLSAVKKVQDASLNFHNLSTSPSGRLDPLVTMEEKDLPKLLLNDVTINEYISANDINLNTSATTTTYLSSPIKPSTEVKQKEDTENNANLSNNDLKFVFDMEQHSNVDEIFNISDTVLKDVIM